jgi:hypothetical protein|tara:strand:- start:320 stop:544 length:225 start_codon:yes stop_codon:yes gene_type:complete
MKTYYNGPSKMNYGGGVTLRKPMMDGGTVNKNKNMQMGGMAEKTIKPNANQPNMMNPMSGVNSIGMMSGGKVKK